MIGFYRRIRKKLADDNQYLKYSRYAVGEILLVVIGILIALQVNNWNEKRKEQNSEIKLIKQLLEDARADSVFFESRMDFQERRDTLYNDLIRYGINSKSDSLAQRPVQESPFFFRLAYQSNLINNNPNAYDFLSDDEIKKKLREYSAVYDYVVHSIDLSNRVIEQYGIPLQIRYQKLFRENFSDSFTVKDLAPVLKDESVIATFEHFSFLGTNYRIQLQRFLIVNQELRDMLVDYLSKNE